MKAILDAMVSIHLAKLSLLEKTCNQFKNIIIPKLVYEEIQKGKKKGFADTIIIYDLIDKKKIQIKKVKDKKLIDKAKQFNIQRGEAEVVALYWEEKRDLIFTDDDNVRKKKLLLDTNIVGTPTIILKLYKDKKINTTKYKQSVQELKKIGWFNNSIIDKLMLEVKNE